MRWCPHIALALGLSVASPAAAQDVVLSDEAWAGLMRVTYATTAAAKCDGAKSNAKRMERAMLELLGSVAAAGQDPVAAVQYIETEAGMAEVTLREAALRAKHGQDAEGDKALCAAIQAEAKADRELGRLVSFK